MKKLTIIIICILLCIISVACEITYDTIPRVPMIAPPVDLDTIWFREWYRGDLVYEDNKDDVKIVVATYEYFLTIKQELQIEEYTRKYNEEFFEEYSLILLYKYCETKKMGHIAYISKEDDSITIYLEEYTNFREENKKSAFFYIIEVKKVDVDVNFDIDINFVKTTLVAV